MSDDAIYLANYNLGDDTSIDSSASIQTAINDALASKKHLIFPPNKNLRVDFQLIVNLSSQNPVFVIKGNNSTLFPSMDGGCIRLNPTVKIEEAISGQDLTHFEIDGLNFDGFFQIENTRALHIGKGGYSMDDLSFSHVKNVILKNFTKQHPILIEGSKTRHILFDSVVSRDNGIQILSTSSYGAIGDLTFRNCEMHYKEGGKGCVDFKASSPYTARIDGVKFENCAFYGGKILLNSSTGGKLSNITLDNCSVNKPIGSSRGIVLSGTGGKINQIFIEDLYASGFSGNIINAELNNDSSLISNGLSIRGGTLALSTATPIKLTNFRGASIDGVKFSDISANFCIEMSKCFKSIISNNIHSDVNGLKPMYILSIDALSKDVIVKNNIGDVKNAVALDLQLPSDLQTIPIQTLNGAATSGAASTGAAAEAAKTTDSGNILLVIGIVLLFLLLSSSSAAAVYFMKKQK